MSEHASPQLYPHDYVMRAVILPFIPDFVQPNHVTVARLLLTPVVLWLLWNGMYLWAVPLFILTAFTDMIDGSLARVRGKITPWGIFFDPVADKLLVGSVALVVGLQHYHPWLVFFAIFLDTLPSLRWASQKHAGGVMMANMWGKTKMVLQCFSLIFLLLGLTLSLPVLIAAGEVTLGVSIVFAIVAIITYSL